MTTGRAQQHDDYVAWLAAARRVEHEFRAWRAARHEERAAALRAYRHALDCEIALAAACATGLRDAHAVGRVRLRAAG